MFLGANIRWRPAAVRYLELIGGGGLAFSNEVQLAVDGGVAVPLPVSRKIAVVPAFTVRFIGRPGSGQGEYLGVAGYAYQFGATVRFSFD